MAYVLGARVSGNPFIIREQVYQDEMTRCVREMLVEFQEGENAMAMLL